MTTFPNDHLSIARRLNDLHQLLYVRGGIRPSNSAVEELSKLLLLRIACARDPRIPVGDYGDLERVLAGLAKEDSANVEAAKAAFAVVNRWPNVSVRLPGGGTQSVWPADEPLRVSRSDVLADAMGILNAIDLGNRETSDPLGTAFDVFLRGRYENAGGLGTYLTPESVVRMMVAIGLELAKEQMTGGLLVGDPCCGSGRFLVGLLHELRQKGTLSDDTIGQLIFGADQAAASVAMARVNLMAAGVISPDVLVVEDSITDDLVSKAIGTFALILTNPPFGDGKYDSVEGIRATAGVLPELAGSRRIDPALAFVARCIDLLAPSGVLGIILPDGVADGTVMRNLLLGPQRLDVPLSLEGVISLPSVTFAPAGTTAKTSVLFLRKGPSDQAKRVFLSRSDHVGHIMRKGLVAPDPEGDDLPAISREVVRFIGSSSSTEAPPSRLTTPLAVELAAIDAASVDAGAGAARTQLLVEGGTPCKTFLEVGVRRRSRTLTPPFVSVLHLDELGNVDWAQAQVHRPTTPGVVAEPGEIIVSLLNPAKFRATVIPETFGAVQCSSEFGVFRSRIDPYAALALLQTGAVRRQIAPLGRGTSSSRRRIDSSDVLSLIVPSYTTEWIEKAAALVRSGLTQVSAGKELLKSVYDTLGPSVPDAAS